MAMMKSEELAALDILSASQLEYVTRLAAELRDPKQTTIHTVGSIDKPSREEIESYQEMEGTMALRCHRITTNHVIKTEKGEVILVYRPKHHENSLSEDDVIQRTSTAMHSFLESKRLKAPSSDIRHTNLNIEELNRLYDEGKYGTIHCACWFEEGKPQDGPMVSREMLMGCRTFNACCKLIADVQPLKDQLSLLYAAASPISWRNCLNKIFKLRKYIPSTRVLTLSEIDPWSSLALVANIPSHIHRDFSDTRHHLTGLSCSGDFDTAWMIIYSLRMRFRYTPSDGLLFNTYLLSHFVREWNPNQTSIQRFSMSFFNHQDVLNWVKKEHVRRNAKVRGVKRKYSE